MKNTYNLVSDIYKLVESKEVAEGVDIDDCIEKFGENVKDLMRKEFKEVRDDSRKLRMSNIGRKDKFLWSVYNDVDKGEDHKKPASESRFNTYSYSGIEKVDENGVSD